MPVMLEYISVIIPREVLEEKYLGGFRRFRASFGDWVFCCDRYRYCKRPNQTPHTVRTETENEVPFRETQAEETIVYAVEPAVVAEVCQTVLNQKGSVTQVSRETGTIAGKFSVGALTNPALINLRISSHSDGTELHIQAARKEALLTSGGAQKALTGFLAALGSDSRLAGAASGGW